MNPANPLLLNSKADNSKIGRERSANVSSASVKNKAAVNRVVVNKAAVKRAAVSKADNKTGSFDQQAVGGNSRRFLLRPDALVKAKSFVKSEEEPIERAREDDREGKSPSTQAGEFVREEIEHIRKGEHGARSPEQAIAIGLSKARRAGVKLPPPKRGKQRTKRQAKRDLTKGRAGRRKKPSRKRSRATKRALKRESGRSASRQALSRHAKRVARQRSARSRSVAAKKAARARKRRG